MKNTEGVKTLFFVGFLSLLFCQCKTDSPQNGQLKISCSSVFLREKPNKLSKEVGSIKEGTLVAYVKETRFADRVNIKGVENTTNWVFVKYENKEGQLSE